MIDLSLLIPEFENKLRDFVLEAQYAGLDVDVQSAYRSLDEQNRLYALGRTVKNPDGANALKPMGSIITNAKGGQSWHNWAVAADVVFRKNDKWDWNAPLDSYEKLARIAQEHGLECGIDFKTIQDPDHFQLTGGMPIQEAMNIGKVSDVWEEIRKRL